MAENRILPLGFIDRTTEDGAVIMLTRPSDSDTLKPETPLALRSRSRGEPTTTARVRGLITAVGYAPPPSEWWKPARTPSGWRASRYCVGACPSIRPSWQLPARPGPGR